MGPETSDDAGVFLISEGLALVQTLDFFSPIVDDPFIFGQIAAANSLSDVYAMGAKPLTALNIACFPSCLSPHEMAEILRGGADKLQEAGVSLLGGHTVENPEPKYGMSVTGLIDPAKLWTNAGAMPGDVLLLTKPLGTGILATAVKAGLLDAAKETLLVDTMRTLNKQAAEILTRLDVVNACTDITGFGLAGHLLEMAKASKVSLVINHAKLPLLAGTVETAEMGLVPAGAYRNREYVGEQISFSEQVSLAHQDIIFDPQTSGGLLISLPEPAAAQALAELQSAGVAATIVGHVIALQQEEDPEGRFRWVKVE